jgi:hypothetical protein
MRNYQSKPLPEEINKNALLVSPYQGISRKRFDAVPSIELSHEKLARIEVFFDELMNFKKWYEETFKLPMKQIFDQLNWKELVMEMANNSDLTDEEIDILKTLIIE